MADITSGSFGKVNKSHPMTPNHGRPLPIHYKKFGLINPASLFPSPYHLNNGHGQTQVSPPLRDRASSDCTTKHRHRGFVPIQQKSATSHQKHKCLAFSVRFVLQLNSICFQWLLLHDQNCNLAQLSNSSKI